MVRAVAVLLLADEPVALLSSRQCAESAAGVLEEQKRDEEAVRFVDRENYSLCFDCNSYCVF